MHRWAMVISQKKSPLHNLPARPHKIRNFHPGLDGHGERLFALAGQSVDFAVSPADRLLAHSDVAPFLKFPQCRVDRSFFWRATAGRGTVHLASDFVAIHRALMQHAEDKKLGQAHLDDPVPIRAIGVVHRRLVRIFGMHRWARHILRSYTSPFEVSTRIITAGSSQTVITGLLGGDSNPKERFDVFVDLIANAAECSQTRLLATLDSCGVFEGPVNPLGTGREYRAAFASVVANCDHVTEVLAEKLVYGLRAVPEMSIPISFITAIPSGRTELGLVPALKTPK